MKISLKEMLVAQISGGLILFLWNLYMVRNTMYMSNVMAILILSFITGFFIVLFSLFVAQTIFGES